MQQLQKYISIIVNLIPLVEQLMKLPLPRRSFVMVIFACRTSDLQKMGMVSRLREL